VASGQPGHRERLIAAMAQSIEEKGYRETTVADVVRIARTSRRNYYEHFEDRAACFLALFEMTNDAVLEQVAAAVRPDRPWDEQVDDAIRALLDTLASRPGLSQSFARELPGLGQAGAAAQRAIIERFADLLVALVETGIVVQPQLDAGPLTREAAIIIVGGLRELTVLSIEQRRDVRELRTVATETVKAILGATVLGAQRSAVPS
jgi:AcrR family transcriptional regulator